MTDNIKHALRSLNDMQKRNRRYCYHTYVLPFYSCVHRDAEEIPGIFISG